MGKIEPVKSAAEPHGHLPMPLRFLMVTTFYPPYHFGGDAIAVQRLARALARRGHHVTVLHDVDAFRLLRRGPRPEVESRGTDEDGVEVHRLCSRFSPASALLTQQTGRPVVHGRRIRRLLDGGAYDVIHYHNISLVGGPGILALGDALKVYEAHEHWLVCPSHVLWRHNRELCTGRECLRCVVAHRRPPQLWRYTGYLEGQLDHVHLFIAKSEFSRRKHREFGFSREMEVLPYFLPDLPVSPRRADLSSPSGEPAAGNGSSPHPRPYFLFVGRLERIKGLDRVIPLFRRFRGADLLVAGDGAEGPDLRKLASNMEGVRFLGSVAPEELEAYYRHAIALLVPSICYETFGIILIEAFRQGTPVIARDLGPFREIVESCGGGELFRSDEELLQAMERLCPDPARRERLGRAARTGFVDHWSEEVIVPRYLLLLERAAEATRRTRLAEALRVARRAESPEARRAWLA